MPVTFPLPAPQATAVSKPKPATGYGNPNSMYCFMKFVICAPARFEMTRSGLALRIFSMNGEKSVTSVATSSSAAKSPPFFAMNRLATLRRS